MGGQRTACQHHAGHRAPGEYRVIATEAVGQCHQARLDCFDRQRGCIASLCGCRWDHRVEAAAFFFSGASVSVRLGLVGPVSSHQRCKLEAHGRLGPMALVNGGLDEGATLVEVFGSRHKKVGGCGGQHVHSCAKSGVGVNYVALLLFMSSTAICFVGQDLLSLMVRSLAARENYDSTK